MTYPGGKDGAGVYQRIINQIPPHETYIELFLGHGAIMLHKLPAERSVGIDCDPEVIHHWEKQSLAAIAIYGDAISFLETHRDDLTGKTFIYADPPYLQETRKTSKPIYPHEFATPEQHKKLLTILLTLPCMVAISGYQSPLYKKMLKGWRSIDYPTRTRGGTVTESLWMNYKEPRALHDYRYLGDDYRERENIARQKRRWKSRLNKMPALQRYAMYAALREFEILDLAPAEMPVLSRK